MAVTNFTSLLGLALPTTGDLSGTWGTTVNDSITSLLDSAVAGTTTLSTDADVTLSTTNGVANQSRQAILLCTGARTAVRTITAPAASKTYVIINATTGGYGVKIVGVGPTTGVTIPNGNNALVAWNGSDFVISAVPFVTPGASGNFLASNGTAWVSSSMLAVANGGTGQITYTDGQLLIGNSTGNTLAKATLTAGSGISVTNGSGSITVANVLPGFSNMVVFTTAGTTSWTVPANVTKAKVTVVGGGGGGGGASVSSTGSSTYSYGGGGGAGGTAIGVVTGLTPGGTVSITVGAAGTAGFGAGGNGGSSSFGASISATGGSGGTNAGTNASGAAGASGSGSGGSLNLSALVAALSGRDSGGNGGWPFLGLGSGGNTGLAITIGSALNGSAGSGYGAGGSGGSIYANAFVSVGRTGGAGTSGIVIVEY